MKKLENYFEKCIMEAFLSEGRTYYPQSAHYFYIIVENAILFSVETPFAKVTRKIRYRLENNIEKNFGFKTEGTGWSLDRVLQPNSVCNHFINTINNRDIYLCRGRGVNLIEPGEVFSCGRYEKLCMAYFGLTTEELKETYEVTGGGLYLPDLGWDEYREVYFKAFGEYPEVKISDYGGNIKLA